MEHPLARQSRLGRFCHTRDSRSVGRDLPTRRLSGLPDGSAAQPRSRADVAARQEQAVVAVLPDLPSRVRSAKPPGRCGTADADAERWAHVAPGAQPLPQGMGRLCVGWCRLLCLAESRLAPLHRAAGRREPVQGDLRDDDRRCKLEALGQRPFRARSSSVRRTARERLSARNQLHAQRPGHPLGSAGRHLPHGRRRPALAWNIGDLARGPRGPLGLVRVRPSWLPALAGQQQAARLGASTDA